MDFPLLSLILCQHGGFGIYLGAVDEFSRKQPVRGRTLETATLLECKQRKTNIDCHWKPCTCFLWQQLTYCCNVCLPSMGFPHRSLLACRSCDHPCSLRRVRTTGAAELHSPTHCTSYQSLVCCLQRNWLTNYFRLIKLQFCSAGLVLTI